MKEEGGGRRGGEEGREEGREDGEMNLLKLSLPAV